MSQITFEEAGKLKYKEGTIYSVTFYDGYVIGHKYEVETFNTNYHSYVPVFGGIYFDTFEEAKQLEQELNKKQLDEENKKELSC